MRNITCEAYPVFFAIPPELIAEDGKTAWLRQDSWTEPEAIPDPIPEDYVPEDRTGKERRIKVISWPECPLNDGRIIVNAVFDKRLVQRLVDYCVARGVDNPMSAAGLQCLDIVGSWAGRTVNAVKNKFPELDGTKEIDDGEGGTIIVSIMPGKIWAFEI